MVWAPWLRKCEKCYAVQRWCRPGNRFRKYRILSGDCARNNETWSSFWHTKIHQAKKISRITAWIQRFAHHIRNPTNEKIGFLSTEKLELAEMYWIRSTIHISYLPFNRLIQFQVIRKLSNYSKLISCIRKLIHFYYLVSNLASKTVINEQGTERSRKLNTT